MVNYYELLSISQDADRASIEQAIKKTRRLWNNRANSPMLQLGRKQRRMSEKLPKPKKLIMISKAKNIPKLSQSLAPMVLNNPGKSIGLEEEIFKPIIET